MLTVLTIAGGVALILFGVRFLRKGLDRLFGPSLGPWMQRAIHNRPQAFLAGLGISVIAPSSTTISVLAVSAVQGGQMPMRQMLAVMFGADIGLTAMVLLISLNVDQFAPILALIGVLLFQFTRHARLRGIGQVVLSLAFIFIGIGTIKRTVTGVELNSDMIKLIEIAEHYPLAMAALAMGMAVMLQSSTATIAMVIALGAAGVVSLPIGVAVVCGANVGIAVTTLLVGWRQIDSRRLALGNLIMKAAIAGVVLPFVPIIGQWIERVPGDMHHRVAYAHTGFNILLAAAGLPMIPLLSRIVGVLAPAPPVVIEQRFGPRHLKEGATDTPALALGMSLREIIHTGEIIREMLADWWQAFKTDDIQLAKRVSKRDDEVDLLDAEIKRFLTRSVNVEGDEQDASEQIRQLSYLGELETIGDIIDKNLCELAGKKARTKMELSKEGWAELEDFYRKVAENLLIADTAFTTRDQELVRQLLDHKEYLRDYDRELRSRHFERLKANRSESHESSAVHLDVLTHLKRINSHVSHVAYALATGPAKG